MNGKFTRYAKLLENNVEPDLCIDREEEREAWCREGGQCQQWSLGIDCRKANLGRSEGEPSNGDKQRPVVAGSEAVPEDSFVEDPG